MPRDGITCHLEVGWMFLCDSYNTEIIAFVIWNSPYCDTTISGGKWNCTKRRRYETFYLLYLSIVQSAILKNYSDGSNRFLTCFTDKYFVVLYLHLYFKQCFLSFIKPSSLWSKFLWKTAKTNRVHEKLNLCNIGMIKLLVLWRVGSIMNYK